MPENENPTQDPADAEEQEGQPEGTGNGDPGQGGQDGGDPEGDGDGDEESPELEKLRRKAARREDALRKAQAELKELKAKAEGAPEEDPVAQANQRLIRAEARTVLAGIGVTDRTLQGEILEVLRLDDIEVDRSGDVDADEIEDRLDRLRKALGGTKGKTAEPARRTPRRQTSDRGGDNGSGGSDADSARFQRILRNQ